jgi:hypothetical protein
MEIASTILGIGFLAFGALAVWFVGSLLIRLRWPAKIPSHLAFEHELSSDKKLREIAEILAKEFKGPAPGNVVCLGPARGSAARLLFHSGPQNRRGNIYRNDYVVALSRRGGKRVAMVLQTNKPYSYLRIRRSEVEPLVEALRQSMGRITSV